MEKIKKETGQKITRNKSWGLQYSYVALIGMSITTRPGLTTIHENVNRKRTIWICNVKNGIGKINKKG